MNKFKERASTAAHNAHRTIPYMITQMIGDFFKKNKIEVHYSIEDNDDTLAYYALQDGAAVLSKDKDFWRYIP